MKKVFTLNELNIDDCDIAKKQLKSICKVGDCLSFDKETGQYAVLDTAVKRNDAGTRLVLTPEEIDHYAFEFRNAKNVGMTDRFLNLWHSDPDVLLDKELVNSLNAAITDTSLAHKCNFDPIVISKIKNNVQIKDYIKQRVRKCDFDGQSYRVWHTDTCNKLISIFNEQFPSFIGGWTYGNSQKVINLYVKYLCVISKRLEFLHIQNFNVELGNKYRSIYNKLDIPVDRFILRSSWNYNKLFGKDRFSLPFISDRQKYTPDYFKENKLKPWSKWNYEDYDKYQRTLHELIESPLDWEGYAWTEGKIEDKHNDAVTKLKKYLSTNNSECLCFELHP